MDIRRKKVEILSKFICIFSYFTIVHQSTIRLDAAALENHNVLPCVGIALFVFCFWKHLCWRHWCCCWMNNELAFLKLNFPCIVAQACLFPACADANLTWISFHFYEMFTIHLFENFAYSNIRNIFRLVLESHCILYPPSSSLASSPSSLPFCHSASLFHILAITGKSYTVLRGKNRARPSYKRFVELDNFLSLRFYSIIAW